MEQRTAKNLFELRPRPGDVCEFLLMSGYLSRRTVKEIRLVEHWNGKKTRLRLGVIWTRSKKNPDFTNRPKGVIHDVMSGDIRLWRDGVELVWDSRGDGAGETP